MIRRRFISGQRAFTLASAISSNHLETDARVRLLFERMSADFSHILRRTDIDYSLKSPSNPQTGPANDQMAFFSEVAGYSDVSGVQQNSVTLVAYRVNNTGSAPCIERLGKALAWSGGTTITSTGTIYPLPFLCAAGTTTIAAIWPAATTVPTSSSPSDPAYDPDYETLVPNAFRFEYYYQLHSGALSATPWDTTAGHTALNGLADVAGIGVVVAVTDHKSTPLVSTASLQTLAGTMADFSSTTTSVGALQQSWQGTVTASTLPAAVRNGIRVYEQVFSIDTPAQ
jgi:hypothetical protein